MKTFEGLRPIITEHFYLDWLSHFKLKDVFAFQQISNPSITITITSNFINATMKDIMQRQALVWGVQDKQSQQFIGIVGLANLNHHKITVYTDLEFISPSSTIEIVQRLLKLQIAYWPQAKPELKLHPTIKSPFQASFTEKD
jgi:RimJ/RimL family protein N-acetyltransferase